MARLRSYEFFFVFSGNEMNDEAIAAVSSLTLAKEIMMKNCTLDAYVTDFDDHFVCGNYRNYLRNFE